MCFNSPHTDSQEFWFWNWRHNRFHNHYCQHNCKCILPMTFHYYQDTGSNLHLRSRPEIHFSPRGNISDGDLCTWHWEFRVFVRTFLQLWSRVTTSFKVSHPINEPHIIYGPYISLKDSNDNDLWLWMTHRTLTNRILTPFATIRTIIIAGTI